MTAPWSPRALAARFPHGQPRYYAWAKYATDPLYAAVHAALAPTTAPLLDVGCGMGLCLVYLRARGLRMPMRGVDFDERKIAVARAVASAHDLDVDFATADARNGLPAHAGSVTLLDVLQFLPHEAQEALVREAAACVTPGGRLVIRAALAAPGWRHTLTRAGDRTAAIARWMKAPPVRYLERDTLEALLRDCGLEGTIRPLWGRTPFNNWLAVFGRPSARRASP